MKRSELENYLGKNVAVYFYKNVKYGTSKYGVLIKCKESWNKNRYFCQSLAGFDHETRFLCSYVLKIKEIEE